MSRTSAPRPPWRRRRSWAWVRLTRPIALVAATATVVGFAFIAEAGSPNWHETLRIGIAMAALVAAAAVYNDVLDSPHDRQVHLWRPVASDLVGTEEALRLAAVLGLVALAVAGSLGWRSFLLFAVGLLAAFIYSASLKRTAFSWVPFTLAFMLVPIWVYDALGRFDDVLWWSIPVGGTGGLAFYLAYKLPDYERDDVDGWRDLLHLATIDAAVPLAWAAIATFLIAAVASANVENLRAEWLIPPAALALTFSSIVMLALLIRVTEKRLLVQRWLTGFSVITMTIGWLGSITPGL